MSGTSLDSPARDAGGSFLDGLDPAPRRLIVFAVAAGVLFDVGLRGGVANAVVVAGVFVLVGALVADGRLPSLASRALAVTAVVPASFLAIRMSAWLAASNTLAIGALLTLAVTYARSGSVLDTTLRRLLRRAGRATFRGLAGPAVIRSAVPPLSSSSARRAVAVARAALTALPFLVAIVALLAAGDAVFAGLLLPDGGLAPAAGHAVLVPVLTAVVLCAVVASSSDQADREHTGRFATAEVVTMLALAAAVLGLFVIAQLVALTDAGRRLVEEAGLTPAEYARSGFFQLAAATGFLVVFLAVVRALAAPEVLRRPALRALGASVPLLATGLVVVSLRRMALYDQAFGLTMLRVWVIGAALWMGALLLMIAVRNLGVGGDRNWVFAGGAAVAVALVVVADVMNPEAFVVRRNLGRAAEGADLDVAYFRQLSDDAVPALAAATDPRLRAGLAATLRCGDPPTGVAAVNLAAARASAARKEACDRDAAAARTRGR
ncbi:MAG: DUF4153 domain-containing protein [Acidimicrobiales bacterium]